MFSCTQFMTTFLLTEIKCIFCNNNLIHNEYIVNINHDNYLAMQITDLFKIA